MEYVQKFQALTNVKIHSSNVGGIDIPPTFEVTTQLLINHKVCKQKSTLVQWFCVIAMT